MRLENTNLVKLIKKNTTTSQTTWSSTTSSSTRTYADFVRFLDTRTRCFDGEVVGLF